MLNSWQKPNGASRSLFGILAFWFSPRIRWNSSSNGALAVSCCIRDGYRQWVRSRKLSPLIENWPTLRCRNRISPQSRPLSSEHHLPYTIGDGGWRAFYDCEQHHPPIDRIVRSRNISAISVVVRRIGPKRIERLLVMVCDRAVGQHGVLLSVRHSRRPVAICFIDTRYQYMVEASHNWSAGAAPSAALG